MLSFSDSKTSITFLESSGGKYFDVPGIPVANQAISRACLYPHIFSFARGFQRGGRVIGLVLMLSLRLPNGFAILLLGSRVAIWGAVHKHEATTLMI